MTWLFSRKIDLAVFAGSGALAALLLVIQMNQTIQLNQVETPEWAWIATILLVDVAHVWSTAFLVGRGNLKGARSVDTSVALAIAGTSWLLGAALYSEGELLFWRALAYLAVFHFVRQQYGWVMRYRKCAGESDVIGQRIDSFAIYMASIYPLAYWHTKIPRNFHWFLTGDFIALPDIVELACRVLYALSIVLYVAHALKDMRRPNMGKHVVVVVTYITWYVGIVATNSDYAFTVMNVLVHGIPYIALVYHVLKSSDEKSTANSKMNFVPFLATLWAIAFAEELLWDKAIWHERSWLFGQPWNLESFKFVLVPLLAVPQATHYILDGFLWKRALPTRENLKEANRDRETAY